MKLSEQKLRQIIREELNSTSTVSEVAPVIAAVARQAAAGAVADKLSDPIANPPIVPPAPQDVVDLITASADAYDADDNEDHVTEGYMKETKEILESAMSKIVTQVATDAAADAVKKKIVG